MASNHPDAGKSAEFLADRQGLAAVAPAIKLDLKLTDTQLGLILGLGFAIFYTLLGLPIARLAEHHSRARIIALSSAVFAGFLFLCSKSRGFSQILLCRVGVGAGELPASGRRWRHCSATIIRSAAAPRP